MASIELCEDCTIPKSPAIWYCPKCTGWLCDECWPKRGPHRDHHPAHIKTPIIDQQHSVISEERYQRIFDPRWTKEERNMLHDRDLATVWVSVEKKTGQGRFEAGMNKRYSQLVSQYWDNGIYTACSPRLISFIGPTMAGKSILIRMLIERPWYISLSPIDDNISVPVVSEKNPGLPTSGDIHLYRDPEPLSRLNTNPLLYADCEGLDAAEIEPPGSVAARLAKNSESQSDYMSALRQWLMQSTQNLEMILPEGTYMPKRETAVGELFPRLLYTFSDVVVYVVKRGAGVTDETIVQNLLAWAQKSASASINRPNIPHVIIAFNKADPPATWDIQQATDLMFQQLSGVFEKNDEIRQHRTRLENSESEKKIHNIGELLRCCYKSVQVIWIPNDTDFPLLSQQVRRLHDMIHALSCESQRQKRESGMLLSTKNQEYFFEMAFKHFTKRIKSPFDFLAQELEMRPISNSLSNNIYLFLRPLLIKPMWQSANAFMEKISPILSSFIALDAVRNFTGVPWTLLQIFYGAVVVQSQRQEPSQKSYRFHLEKAIKLLCDRACYCEFRNSNERCINFRSGHERGHQAANGDQIGSTDFRSNFVEELESSWERVLQSHLTRTDDLINTTSISSSNRKKLDATWSVHTQNIRSLYSELSHIGRESTCICFFCLSNPPFHILPCRHSICVPCARNYESLEDHDKRLLSIKECILHRGKKIYPNPCIIQVKPPSAGIRILSLDGGGIRGIIELCILNAIEEKLGHAIKIQRFFDLIAGTSGGGLVAIGLGIKDWAVQDCIKNYVQMCTRGIRARSDFTLGKWAFTVMSGSIYQTDVLESTLSQEFGNDEMINTKTPDDHFAHVNKVFVTTTIDNGETPDLISNYVLACAHSTSLDTSIRSIVQSTPEFELSQDGNKRFRLWEAARATSAAPGYFTPFKKSGEDHWDGGLFHNNPAYVASLEAGLLWPDAKELNPDILLSIGTGHGTRPASTTANDSKRSLEALLQFAKGWMNEQTIARAFRTLRYRLLKNLNSEDLWRKHFQYKSERDPTRYIRLNLKFPGPQPPMDQVSGLTDGSLVERANEFIADNDKLIERVAQHLVATSFYFSVSREPYQDFKQNFHIHGVIRCRFLDNSNEIHSFGQLLRRIPKPAFVLEHEIKRWNLTQEHINDMERDKTFQLPIDFETQKEDPVGIKFGAQDRKPRPISGFPRAKWTENIQGLIYHSSEENMV